MSGGRLDHDVHALDAGAVRALWDLLGGDREALVELVDAFLDEAPQRLEEIKLGAAQGDAALAGRAAHTLKSNAATFGAVELAALCRRLEAAAGAGALESERELIAGLDGAWAQVRAELVALRDGDAP